jgi:uncharacterized membrane protein YhaH (DUF805 family)
MLAFVLSPSGRIGRGKWWLAQLVTICIIISFVVLLSLQLPGKAIDGILVTESSPGIDPMFAAEFAVFAIFLIWMGFCITVKRYHDRGKSGWWYLLQFVPIVGPIWAFIELGFCSGDDGDNDYGDGPDLNIADDLKALRKQRGQQDPVVSPTAYRPAHAIKIGGPAVFGKRG